MNPETPNPSREEIEAKLTALLLGELPAEEAQLLRRAISQDAALKKLHDRLQLTIGLVREAAKNPAETIPAQTAPLKFSDERREKLLAHFKTIAPREFVPLVPPLKKRREISPLLAMAAAIAIIAVLAAMLLPALSKAKNKSARVIAMNQEKLRELNVSHAAITAVTETAPSATPQAGLNQRVAGLEAYIQNGNPTSNGGDAWKKQTTIVLPAGGTDEGELAAASPAPIDAVNSFGLAGDRFGVGGVGGGGASGNFQQQSESIDRRAKSESSGGFSTGLTKDNVSELRDLRVPQSSVAQNQTTKKFSETTSSGFVDVGAQSFDNRSSFYRNIAPDSGADKKSKVPMLGDVPVMGNLFRSRTEKESGDIGSPNNLGEGYGRNTPHAVNAGTFAFQDNISDGLSKSRSDSATLRGNKSYSGVTTIGGGSFEAAANKMAVAETDQIFHSGLTKDDVNGLRDLLTTNNVQFENNGTVVTARIAADSDTHNLAVIADKETPEQIRSTLKNLDQAPIAAPAAPHILLGPIPNEQKNSLALNYATPLAPTVAPALPVTVAQNTIVNNGWIGNVHNQEAKTESQPQTPKVSLNYSDISPDEDRPIKKLPSPAPVPTPEILTRENAFSTFSLNVSDVSFKLAAASLEKGQLPDAASIRAEEFINAFDYHDPEPAAGVPVAFVAERARDPFTQNRDLLRFSIKTAAAGREPGRPLNLVLLLDNSGSMERADRVAIIHEALKVLASQLQPQDTLSIVTFARTARLWVDGARGDQAGTAVNKVSDLTPEGGTNLEEAMNLAYATARRHYLAQGVNRVVLLTDGAANLGNVNPEALKQKVESFRKQGIALDCFGIGWEGYNDDLLEVLSSNGDGRYGFINTPEAATTEFAAQLAGALHVAAEDVKVQVEFNPQRVISYRQIGYAKHQLTKEQFRDNTVAAAPLAAREAGNALYTVEINPQGSGPVATVRVRFRIPGTTDVSEHEWQVPFDGTAPALEKSSPALRLAATASAFSEWLASSPFAQEVTTDQLLNYLNGVPQIYGADARPKQLETMIREAKSLSGK